ncbi:MAG: immune inhibitor A [Pseudomonadales bacterium]|jgi:M6 family metalloprotease-like protein|nr:immune inhibitor A [Pseudomonadales bacterium]
MARRLPCLFLPLLLLIAAAPRAQTPESLAMIDKLAHLRFEELGNPQIKSDAIHPVLSTPEKPHRMLIIPVQYANRDFDRFAGEADAAERNRDYLQHMLFAEDLRNPREKTLTHYYWHQSQGRYYVTGEVLTPVTVGEPSEYYGMPVQNSAGAWRNDVRAEALVEDALNAALTANPDFPWRDFDVWDPLDYDGDGVYEEADGYIDHFVLVYAGKAQSSCQGLFNLSEKFIADAPADLYERLSAPEQECVQRIWPHRFSLSKNNGHGPVVEGFENKRGGVALTEGLWVYDYNMQSEYTSVSTFVHEFGHSLGLPDIYASSSNNSTAAWDAMSSTASPNAQEFSTWSRLMLGWSEPCVITPRMAGGSRVQSLYLKTMSDWSPNSSVPEQTNKACDAALVILPPKIRELRLGPLTAANGKQAAYTGQGNDLNHYLARRLDLRALNAAAPILLDLDAWFRIEADWDYLYVEISSDGVNYTRLMPTDKNEPGDTASVMPSRRGHDGMGTIPGFTGFSGDLDGDGRVESAPGCDPTQARALDEERIGAEADPCEAAAWIHASFDLSAYRGQEVELRFHYFADAAAAEDGALIDNLRIAALDYADDFEAENFQGWKVEGFSLSGGSHDILVPQFYLLEYRDPYAQYANAYNYDRSLDGPGFSFFRNPDSGAMEAVDFRYRSGVLMWYYNGSYLWSQNEPSQFGPGQGFLLLVDPNPQEFDLAAVPESYYKDDAGWRHYEFDAEAQTMLRDEFLAVMCFQRRPAYYPVELSAEERQRCGEGSPAGEALRFEDRQLLYSYTLSNEFLPGEAREGYKSMGSLFDYRVNRDGSLGYRLYERLLRSNHSADAAFSLEDFPEGLQYYAIENGAMRPVRATPYPTISSFSDAAPARYLNPYLPFGSAAIPNEGLNFELAAPGPEAPVSARVKVYFTWDR